MTARTINVRLPEALYNQIEELAKATARTKSFLAIDALTHYVQSESWQIRDINEGIKEAAGGEFATDRRVKRCSPNTAFDLCRSSGPRQHFDLWMKSQLHRQ